jgi:hypothetical protein
MATNVGSFFKIQKDANAVFVFIVDDVEEGCVQWTYSIVKEAILMFIDKFIRFKVTVILFFPNIFGMGLTRKMGHWLGLGPGG